MSNVTVQGKQAADRTNVEELYSTNNSLHTAPSGVVTAASGTARTYVLSVDTTPADAAANRYDNSTGCKAFRFKFLSAPTAATDKMVYGWSTSAGDFTALDTITDTYLTNITTPAGTAITQVGAAFAGLTGYWVEQATDWVVWDGTNRIKTIVPEMSANTATVALEVIE